MLESTNLEDMFNILDCHIGCWRYGSTHMGMFFGEHVRGYSQAPSQLSELPGFVTVGLEIDRTKGYDFSPRGVGILGDHPEDTWGESPCHN